MSDLAEAWEANAKNWIAWARAPNHDSYWHFHRDAFFASVPAPGKRTIDIGCGEGRVSRDLKARGHRVVGIDASATLIAAATELDPTIEALVARAESLPFEAASFDLAIAFMSPHDVDDLDAMFEECARVLEPGGKLVFAVVHPINSAGDFKPDDGDDPAFVMPKDRPYLDSFRYHDHVERDGLVMDFSSVHRPLEAYSRALEGASFVVESLREPKHPSNARWRRLPLFLHVRARRE